MSNRLKNLFEYQKFEQNPRLASLIAETESRCMGSRIDEEDLDMVMAAQGNEESPSVKKPICSANFDNQTIFGH